MENIIQDIALIIIGNLSKIDKLNFLSINKYYSKIPIQFFTKDYADICESFEFRIMIPENISIKDSNNINCNLSKITKITMPYIYFTNLKQPIQFKHLILLQPSYFNSELNINNIHTINTLEINSYTNEKILINCEKIDALNIYKCKRCTIYVTDKNNNLKTLDFHNNKLDWKNKIYGVESNPNLVIHNYFEEYFDKMLSLCTILHTYNFKFCIRGIINNYISKGYIDNSVKHKFDDNTSIFTYMLDPNMNEIDIDIPRKISNCTFHNVVFELPHSEKNIIIENCKINKLEYNAKKGIDIKINNCEINEIKYVDKSENPKFTIRNSIINSIIYDEKSTDIFSIDSKIKQIFLNFYRKTQKKNISLYNIAECYHIVIGPKCAEHTFEVDNINKIKLHLGSPIIICGNLNMICVDKKSKYLPKITLNNFEIAIINESNYVKINNSYVFDTYIKKN